MHNAPRPADSGRSALPQVSASSDRLHNDIRRLIVAVMTIVVVLFVLPAIAVIAGMAACAPCL